jgi:hypothetical protein
MNKHRCCKVNICETSGEPDVETAKAKKKKKNDPTPKAVLPQQDQDPPQSVLSQTFADLPVSPSSISAREDGPGIATIY